MADRQDTIMSDSPFDAGNSFFNHNDPLYNFNYPSLVDEDDPGFEIDSDNNDNDSNSDSSTYSDYDEKGNELSLEEKICKGSDQILNDFVSTFEAEYVKQPKSTQIILNHDASKLYKSYGQHGSEARLSAAVMDFLTKQDMALRPTKRLVEQAEVDKDGRETGQKTKQWMGVIDRAILTFAPLPDIGVRHDVGVVGETMEMKMNKRMKKQPLPYQQQSVIGGKRKARDFSEDRGGRIPCGPFTSTSASASTSLGRGRGGHGQTTLPIRNGSPSALGAGRKKCYDKHGFEIEINDPFQSHARLYRLPTRSSVGNPSYRLGAEQQQQQRAQKLQEIQSAVDRNNMSFGQMLACATPTISPTTSSTAPPLPLIDRDRYSCTVDHETQNLLTQDPTNPSPLSHFNPLAGLNLTNFLVPADSPSIPQSLNIPISKILRLHSLSASTFLTHLTLKYTITPTPINPLPPSPPLALFRLGITTHLHSQLEHTFTSMSQDPMYFSPKTRGLLREIYERKRPGQLNGVESEFLSRVLRVGEEGVRVWWEKRNLERRAWWALQVWVRNREIEKVRAAGLEYAKEEEGEEREEM